MSKEKGAGQEGGEVGKGQALCKEFGIGGLGKAMGGTQTQKG